MSRRRAAWRRFVAGDRGPTPSSGNREPRREKSGCVQVVRLKQIDLDRFPPRRRGRARVARPKLRRSRINERIIAEGVSARIAAAPWVDLRAWKWFDRQEGRRIAPPSTFKRYGDLVMATRTTSNQPLEATTAPTPLSTAPSGGPRQLLRAMPIVLETSHRARRRRRWTDSCGAGSRIDQPRDAGRHGEGAAGGRGFRVHPHPPKEDEETSRKHCSRADCREPGSSTSRPPRPQRSLPPARQLPRASCSCPRCPTPSLHPS